MKENQNPDLKKSLLFWAGSYVVVATWLYLRNGAPLTPLIIAGIATLAVVVLRNHFKSHK